jgi:hypothetical protein
MANLSPFVVVIGSLVGGATGCGSGSDLVIGRNETPLDSRRDASDAAGGIDSDRPNADVPDGEVLDTDADGETDAPTCTPGEVPPPTSLVLRYTFDGTGSVITDSVGTSDGNLMKWGGSLPSASGATLDGSGTLTLNGTDDYVDLPNGLISVLANATFMVWTKWRGGSGYQRIFDFGSSMTGEDRRSSGTSFIMVSPFTGALLGRNLGVQTRLDGGNVLQINTSRAIEDNLFHQIVVVFRSGAQIELYVDGVLLGVRAIAFNLSQIEDVNNWLGMSQWSQDNNYAGMYDEFRIYGDALSACAIATTNAAGPNSLP